jgi:hypothetical protein
MLHTAGFGDVGDSLALPDLGLRPADIRILHTVDTVGSRKDWPEGSDIIHIALHHFSAARC